MVTPSTTDLASLALSPDGRRLAFVATADRQSRLWVRALGSVTAQALAGTEGATYFRSGRLTAARSGSLPDSKLFKRLDIAAVALRNIGNGGPRRPERGRYRALYAS